MTVHGKLVGKVTSEERDQICELYSRQSALNELFVSLSKLDADSVQSTALYEKLVHDIGEATEKFQRWWDDKARRYGWEGRPGGKWKIDFETCEVFLL